ncbi:MAG: hypothetical protein RLZZ204_1404, partial [Bacteroidota bacterium]
NKTDCKSVSYWSKKAADTSEMAAKILLWHVNFARRHEK